MQIFIEVMTLFSEHMNSLWLYQFSLFTQTMYQYIFHLTPVTQLIKIHCLKDAKTSQKLDLIHAFITSHLD